MARTEVFDLTPTWAQILPALITAVKHATPDGQKVAKEELRRMAEAADKWNEYCKSQKSNS